MEKKVYAGNYVSVTEEKINDHVYEKVYIGDGVIIFPFVSRERILLVKERRLHENPPYRLKTVTGFYESDQSFEENVNRELQEEIGKKANFIIQYKVSKRTGTINQTKYFALAYGLVESKLDNPDGEDSISEIVTMTLDEIYASIMAEQMWMDDIACVFLKLYHDLKNKQIKLSIP